MADGLEEPGGPWLGQPADPGRTFLNAFALMSQVNNRKQQLEQQLAEMQSNNLYKQQAHDLDMKQFGWKQKMDMANLSRQDSAEQSLATYRDRMASLGQDKLDSTLAQKDALAQNAAKYGNDLQELIQKYPDTYANQAFQNELSLLQGKYAPIAGTIEGKREWGQFQGQIKTAQLFSHQNSKDVLTNVQNTLKAGSRTPGLPWTLPDLGLDPQYHIGGTDAQGNDTLGIAEQKVINPQTNSFTWKPLTKDDLNKGATPDRWRTINQSAAESAMPLYQHISGIASGDPNKMPAVVEQRVRVKDPNGNTGTLPADQLNDALAAGWSQE